MALVTGDAEGSDRAWIRYARRQNHQIYVLLPKSRKSCRVDHDKLAFFDAEDTNRQHILAQLAIDVVRRKNVVNGNFPYLDYLHRDIAQAQYAHFCYALAHLRPLDSAWPIKGGTAWATAAFYKLYGLDKLFIYDLDNGYWVKLVREGNKWATQRCQPPKPQGQYAGIGTRDVAEDRALAIIEQL